MTRKKRVIGMFPEYFLKELEENHEIHIDTLGRVRGLPEFVERMYLMDHKPKRRKGGF